MLVGGKALAALSWLRPILRDEEQARRLAPGEKATGILRPGTEMKNLAGA